MAIPLIIPAAIGAAAAIGGGVALASGAGRNNHVARPFQNPQGYSGYDPNAARWGRSADGLSRYTQAAGQAAQAVDARQANTANYDQANQWQQQSALARGGQQATANMMAARAQGHDSVSQQQAAIDMQRAAAAQSSQAASARGAAGLALAQQNAASNTANAQSAISSQAQVNAANERMQAEQSAYGAYSGLRQGDVASQAQAANQSQFQAGMEQQNRGANDARAMGYEQLGFGALQGEMNAQTQNQAILAGSYDNKERLEAQRAKDNADTTKFWINKIIPSDERMKMGLNGGGMGGSGSGMGDAVSAYLNSNKGDDPTKKPEEKSDGGMDMGQMMNIAASAYGSGAFSSDTRTKQAALLDQGRAQGMALARGGRGASYDTQLSPEEESAFGRWKKQYAPMDSGADYDLRGAFLSGTKPGADGHWPDTYKKPNHPTFSNESAYATGENAAKAGEWQGDRFVDPKTRAALDDRYRQNTETIGKPALDAAISSRVQEERAPWHGALDAAVAKQVEHDRAAMAHPSQRAQDKMLLSAGGRSADDVLRDETARTQWEKSFGSSEQAANDVRTSDNMAEAAKIRSHFGQEEGGSETPWYMQDVGPALSILSDERAKRSAYLLGRAHQNELAATGKPPGGGFEWDPKEGEDLVDGGPGINKEKHDREAGIRQPTSFSRDRPQQPQPGLIDRAITAADKYSDDYLGVAAGPFAPALVNEAIGRNEPPPKPREMKGFARDKTREPTFYMRDYDPREMKSFERDKSPVAEANRSMQGEPYAYKPGFVPPDQKPGEPNYGPMAQNLEKSPVASTAVKVDPASGMRVLDKDKLIKVLASGVSDLQRQQDETRMMLSRGGRR